MGRVGEVYPGLVKVSLKSENSLYTVSAALFFCCIICGLQIGTCIYGNILSLSSLIYHYDSLMHYIVNFKMQYRICNLRALSRHINFEGIPIDTTLIYDETLKTCKIFFTISNFLVIYIFCVKLVYSGITPYTQLIRLLTRSLTH